jgi:heme exporter protein D
MSEFLAMGGYGWYVWMSYGACALAIAAEALALRLRRRRALDEARAVSADTLPSRRRSDA